MVSLKTCMTHANLVCAPVQAERIELLDKLEQFPLKIRVKEDQDKILRSIIIPCIEHLTASS